MNSIRPLATLIILVVIGVGLYSIINTSEPVIPEEAGDAVLEVPQIEDDWGGLAEADDPNAYDPIGDPPQFDPAAPLAAPPPWTPPQNSSSDAPTREGSEESAVVSLPEIPQNNPLPDVSGQSLPRDATSSLPPGDANPFTAQLHTQPQNGTQPAEITNPYVSGEPVIGQGNVPPAIVDSDPFPNAAQAPSNASGPSIQESAPSSLQTIPAVEDGSTAASENSPRQLPPPTVANGNFGATSTFSVARAAIDQTLQRGDLSQALLMLSEFCGDPQLTPIERKELDTLLSQLAGTVIYSSEYEMEPHYQVQLGESLVEVAGRYHVTPELLAKINGLADPNQVPPGTRVKLVRGPFDAVLDQQGLRLMLDGRYAGRFEADGPTGWTSTAWVVDQKLPVGPPAPGSAPQIVLRPASPAATPNPVVPVITSALPQASLPQDNRRWIQVSSKDLNDLFDILTVGSRVTIRR